MSVIFPIDNPAQLAYIHVYLAIFCFDPRETMISPHLSPSNSTPITCAGEGTFSEVLKAQSIK